MVVDESLVMREAVRCLLQERGRGASRELARHLGRYPQAISNFLSGAKTFNTKTMSMIAAYFGMTYGELISLGEALVRGEESFSLVHKLHGLQKDDQASMIVEHCNGVHGLEGLLKWVKPPFIEDFLGNKITAKEFFDLYNEHLERLKDACTRVPEPPSK